MLAYMESSFHGYITNIRQKASEDIFISRYRRECGKEVHYGWKLQGHEVSNVPADGYNVTVAATHIFHGQMHIRW
jgi:phenol 2-monooxygenase